MRAHLVVVALLATSAACAGGDPASPSVAIPARPEPAPIAAPAPTDGTPKNIRDLFAARMLPTCALNGGVCHNSKNYPDLRDLAALEDLVDRPCGLNVDGAFPDACEPAGDRIVGGAVDVGILRASFDGAASTTMITTDGDVPGGAIDGAHVERALRSGTWSFDVTGAVLEGVAPRTVIVHLAGATDAVRTFFAPELPLREDHVWPADVNGNGVAGATLGWREIRPGRPDRSWIVARLWDTDANAELMPRQCREWDDDATHALGCWVEGLRTDASGAVVNFWDDIDYTRCTFTAQPGRCGSGLTPARIVDSQCAGCHGATDPASGLDLRSASLHTSTVGVASRERPDMRLVEPGKPEASYLFLKIAEGPPATSGERMPKGGRLTDTQIEAMRDWIAAGAP